jgi:tetratricopeptide (TPR) repeat protein
MKKTSFLFAAMLVAALGSGFSPVSISSVHARADESAEKPKNTVRKEFGVALPDIQKLLDEKQYPQAMEKIAVLDAMDKKTPYEEFALHRMRAIVASSTNNTPLLATSFSAMINSEFLKDNEKLRLMEGLAGTFYNEKKYDEAILWANRMLEKDPANLQTHNLIAKAYYLKQDYPASIKKINEILALDDAAKRAPTEESLRLLASCYQHLKDNAGYTTVLERMVAHYPTREYWGDMIYRTEHKAGFSDRLRLDLYRLMIATGNMDDAGQYVEMAELALLAGLPAEAKTAMDAGYAANLLGTGKEGAKHKQLRDRVNKQATEDLKTLDAGEASAKTAKTGTGLVNIGYNYVINGQADKGIPLMEQGIAKGGLKSADEAKLHLGMAYLKSGNRDKAKEVFQSLQGNDGAADIGRLWLLVRPLADK